MFLLAAIGVAGNCFVTKNQGWYLAVFDVVYGLDKIRIYRLTGVIFVVAFHGFARGVDVG